MKKKEPKRDPDFEKLPICCLGTLIRKEPKRDPNFVNYPKP